MLKLYSYSNINQGITYSGNAETTYRIGYRDCFFAPKCPTVESMRFGRPYRKKQQVIKTT
uniref:Uncharacterized protein n=1 Tax=Myoviridae sp. ct9Ns12 TaxID=2826626 RepID=A0A8S5MHF1_9CAUD|nr:MAG TPA: hypothetical protein [Myoviridae sp. ct9Ns12]